MEHILSLSYGKDSLACLGAIEILSNLHLRWRISKKGFITLELLQMN